VSAFNGVHHRPLQPKEAAALLAAERRCLGVRTKAVPIERLRDPEVARMLILDWGMAVMQADASANAQRKLNNTDGHPILFTTDHYEIEPAQRAEVTRRLKLLPLVRDHEEDADGVVVLTCLRDGNPKYKSWPNTIVGKIEISDRRIRVETNSVARADLLRSEVEVALGTLGRHVLRDHVDPEAVVEEVRARERGECRDDEPPPPEELAVLRRHVQQHWDEWPDAPLPALDGLTPRESVTKPAMRRRLVELLKEFECRDAIQPAHHRYDLARLWDVLGLDRRTGQVLPKSRGTAPGTSRR
jgi:hypothetical protein